MTPIYAVVVVDNDDVKNNIIFKDTLIAFGGRGDFTKALSI